VDRQDTGESNMTIQELIDRLKKMPADAKFEISTGYEKGPGKIRFFKIEDVSRFPHDEKVVCISIKETNRFQ